MRMNLTTQIEMWKSRWDWLCSCHALQYYWCIKCIIFEEFCSAHFSMNDTTKRTCLVVKRNGVLHHHLASCLYQNQGIHLETSCQQPPCSIPWPIISTNSSWFLAQCANNANQMCKARHSSWGMVSNTRIRYKTTTKKYLHTPVFTWSTKLPHHLWFDCPNFT